MSDTSYSKNLAIKLLLLLALEQNLVFVRLTDSPDKLDVPTLESLDKLYDLARLIESTGQRNGEILDDMDQTKSDLIYQFLRPSKLAHADFKEKKNREKAEDFRAKATELARPRNLVSGLFNWGTVKHLGQIAKNDPLLEMLVNKYTESRQKVEPFDVRMVDCDIANYLLLRTDKIMYVAETEVKHLLVEDQARVTRAIYDELKASKFHSNSNFFNEQQLNQAQKIKIRDFYSAYVISDDVSIQEAIDHYKEPTEYLIHRLFETCSAVNKFELIMAEHKRDATKWCSGDVSKNELEKQLSFGRPEGDSKQRRDVVQLCHHLLAPL